MKLRGEIPSLGWGELLWNLRPHSNIYLGALPSVRNLDLAIGNPYATPADSAQGAEAFRHRCAACHGMDARSGTVGPSLVSGARRARSDWALYRRISQGVPGTAMRAHDLSPQAVWQLVTYIQSLRSADTLPIPQRAINVPFSKLLNADADTSGWYTYSGGYYSHRFSPLKAINGRTIRRLRVAWQYQSAANEMRFETSPLAISGALYFTEPPGNVVAVDAVDGSLRWRYVRPVPDGLSLCCGAVNRGLAAMDSLLYVGTLDAHLIALDARNGEVVWDRAVADWHDRYSITGAPLAVKNKVITGVAGGEFGIRGFLAAFDAGSGKPSWRLSTVPSPGEPGSETWVGESWKRGGSPTWLTGSYDPRLNLIYWGVGNPAPDFNGEERQGDNLYSNSVIAVDADAGTLRWHFQFTPHDEHDWDAVQVPVLIDTVYNGVSRPLMAWANRNAFYYLLDRETGKFLFARPFARQTWASSFDSAGRPHVLPSSRPSQRGSPVYPAVGGATNWWSPSFSERTGLLYVPVVEGGSIVYNETPRFEPGELFLSSTSQDPSSAIPMVRALDPLTGKIKWEHKFEPKPSGRHPNVGGILSLGGDLVFVGSDQTLYALDARTGDELWSFNTGGRIAAAPVTYFASGKQYVAIAAGRSLIAFALDADYRN